MTHERKAALEALIPTTVGRLRAWLANRFVAAAWRAHHDAAVAAAGRRTGDKRSKFQRQKDGRILYQASIPDVTYVLLQALPKLAREIGLKADDVTMRLLLNGLVRVHAGSKQADVCPNELIDPASRDKALRALKEALGS